MGQDEKLEMQHPEPEPERDEVEHHRLEFVRHEEQKRDDVHCCAFAKYAREPTMRNVRYSCISTVQESPTRRLWKADMICY